MKIIQAIFINIFFLYKKGNYILSAILNRFYSFCFYISLWLNGVERNGTVRVSNAIPVLELDMHVHLVQLCGNNLFNNYTGNGWFCRCKIMVSSNATFIMGKNSGMSGTLIYCSSCIKIGDYVNIGGGTRIIDTDFHSLDWRDRRVFNETNAKSVPVYIGDDVFIGAGCIICKGVSIGARSIIGAGSVVTKSIPPDQIWGGNPAEFIRNI